MGTMRGVNAPNMASEKLLPRLFERVQMWELTNVGSIGIRIASAVGILNLSVIYVRNAGQTRNGQATLNGRYRKRPKRGVATIALHL